MVQKTILITGSGSGFGLATALALSRRKHRVIATVHQQDQVEKIQEQAQKEQLDIESFVLDITKPSDRKKVRDFELDVLVNNAGIGETGSLAEIEIEKVRENFEVNVFSSFAITQEVLKDMIPKKRGKIVFISSLLGRTTSPFFGPYSMTKHALSSGAKMLADELSLLSPDLRVALVEPGAYHTGFNQKMMAKKFTWMNEHSYFALMMEKIRTDENSQFGLVEVKNIESIVNVIVRAVERDDVGFRSSAPWWQSLYVELSRWVA